MPLSYKQAKQTLSQRCVCEGGTQHDHLSVPVRTKCSYLLVFLKLKDLQNLKLSSPRYSCLSTCGPTWRGTAGSGCQPEATAASPVKPTKW